MCVNTFYVLKRVIEMEKQDSLKIKGTFTAVKRNVKTGEVSVTRKDNIILNVGFDIETTGIGVIFGTG